jgi:hypothetical protein
MTANVTKCPITANVTEWKRAASGLLAIAVVGVGAVACSQAPPARSSEEGALSGSSAQNVDPVQLRKSRGGGGGGGGGY